MPFNVVLPPPSTAASRWTTPRCNLCGLYKGCKSPKMPVTGKGRKRILIVGEAPGRNEDEKNKQFVGDSGQLLEECLDEVGINMRRDCHLDNALICRPPNNATPTSEQISYCYPNLRKTIKDLKPDIILTVGRSGLESVLTGIWKEDIGPIGRWVGWTIPSVDLNAWIIPTYHPSFVMRESQAKMGSPLRTIFVDHLDKLNQFDSKPYETIPDYTKQVEVILDPNDAAEILDRFRMKGGPISLDYETDSLKPDKDGKLFSAAVCWRGKRTIAFPWYGQTLMVAWDKLMQSECPKIGFNSKFEDRWTRRQTAPKIKGEKRRLMRVNNWKWCGMIGAHIEDNRRGICSLGFQTFVKLGVGDYSAQISPYLQAKDSYSKNNIKNANLNQVLLYNGLDALFTYLIAEQQMSYLGIKL